jgi:putative peptidoglycan lipid II flippase
LAPAFYSRQNIKTPVKIALFTLVITQLMNVLFVFILDFKEFKHAGLALAIGLGACVNASLLFYHLRKKSLYQPQAGWAKFALKLLLAVVVMSTALHVAAGADTLWFGYGLFEKMLRLLGLLLIGVTVYFAMLWSMGIRIQDFIRRTAV